MDTAVPFLAPYDPLSGYWRAMKQHVQAEIVLAGHDDGSGLFGRVSLVA
jgi:hypothetical protein